LIVHINGDLNCFACYKGENDRNDVMGQKSQKEISFKLQLPGHKCYETKNNFIPFLLY